MAVDVFAAEHHSPRCQDARRVLHTRGCGGCSGPMGCSKPRRPSARSVERRWPLRCTSSEERRYRAGSSIGRRSFGACAARHRRRGASTGTCHWDGRARRRDPATLGSTPRRIAWPRSCRSRRVVRLRRTQVAVGGSARLDQTRARIPALPMLLLLNILNINALHRGPGLFPSRLPSLRIGCRCTAQTVSGQPRLIGMAIARIVSCSRRRNLYSD